jgi:cell division protein FtsB
VKTIDELKEHLLRVKEGLVQRIYELQPVLDCYEAQSAKLRAEIARLRDERDNIEDAGDVIDELARGFVEE